MLVRISENVHVDPTEVQFVEVLPESSRVCVRLKGGAEHRIERDYGKTAWDKQVQLVALINERMPRDQLQGIAIDLRNAYEAKDRDAHDRAIARLVGAGG